jgi:hypothetical protein
MRHTGTVLAIPLSGDVTLAGDELPAGGCGLAACLADLSVGEDAVVLLASEA